MANRVGVAPHVHEAIHGTINVPIGDGAVLIPAGVYLDLPKMPVGGVWHAWRVTGTKYTTGSTGSIQIDLWNGPFSAHPLSVSNTITGTDKPRIVTATKNESIALTGWDKTFDAGDIIRINIDSVQFLTLCTLSLEYIRNI